MFSSRKSAAPSAGYLLTKSLRFRSSASAYLQRSFSGSQTDSKKATVSFWFKLGQIGNTSTSLYPTMMGGVNDAQTIGRYIGNLRDNNNFTMQIGVSDDGNFLETTQVFRDPSAWYHLVVSFDSTQATASNRVKVYLNGTQITAFSTANYPSQNSAFVLFRSTNSNNRIGGQGNGGAYFDGYMTEINSVDGQALTPSSFGATNAATGVWQPIKYTGTYGNWGFYLPFTDVATTSGSNAGLGKDFSGNGNYWTTNNISVTSGTTYDSMSDVPTLTSATTANYCVVNPLSKTSFAIIKGANLNVESVDSSANIAIVGGTFGVTSGKWYWEVTATAVDSTRMAMYVCDATKNGQGLTSSTGAYGYGANGNKIQGDGTNWYGTSSAYGNSWTTNDVIGVALDLDNGKVWFSKNGTWQASGDPAAGTNAAFTSVSGSKTCGMYLYTEASTTSAAFNLGQRPFSYTPPTGFVALNTFNLPTPTIGATASSLANKYFDATAYTGTGSSLSVTNSGSMQPDLVWVKERSQAQDHALFDAVRGATKQLSSNTSGAEATYANSLSAFNSNGFTVVSDAVVNSSSQTYVGWQWNAGGSNATNTSGSITSTVRANTTAGFSIVTYTGNGSTGTVGHGLGVAPSMYIVKRLSGSPYDWYTYHVSLGNTQFIRLNTTGAASTFNLWQNTTPTSSVFYLANDTGVNASSTNFVAYCFAQVAGYSAFGSYTGSGLADGPFIYLGFKPAYLMIKRTDSADGWLLIDNKRNTYNPEDNYLFANVSDAEGQYPIMDFVANGFKIRSFGNSFNDIGTFIYMAFAESPFKYANAR